MTSVIHHTYFRPSWNMIMRVQQHSGSDAVLQPIDVVSETVHAIDSANNELRRLNLEVRLSSFITSKSKREFHD